MIRARWNRETDIALSEPHPSGSAKIVARRSAGGVENRVMCVLPGALSPSSARMPCARDACKTLAVFGCPTTSPLLLKSYRIRSRAIALRNRACLDNSRSIWHLSRKLNISVTPGCGPIDEASLTNGLSRSFTNQKRRCSRRTGVCDAGQEFHFSARPPTRASRSRKPIEHGFASSCGGSGADICWTPCLPPHNLAA